jgi:hypothetical protein
VTFWNVQSRFSMQPTSGRGSPGEFGAPWQSGAVCTSAFICSWPSDRSAYLPEKNTVRSCVRRSRESNGPLERRSQSVQSLSPGVKNAGFLSELKKPSACT